MAGGTFVDGENKVRPGLYMNFISAALASIELSEIGITILPMVLNWGNKGEFVKVESLDYIKQNFSVDISDDSLLYLREAFKNAKTVLVYCLNAGTKASKTFGSTSICTVTAKKAGTRGNSINIVSTTNPVIGTKKDVKTYLDGILVSSQTVTNIQELIANDYVTFSGTGAVETTTGAQLSGGTTTAVTNSDYTDLLSAAETQTFDTIALPTDDATLKTTFTGWVKRLRDEEGKKIVGVINNSASDYEGIINVTCGVKLSSDQTLTAKDCVPWVAGASAASAANKSLTYFVYEGAVDAVPRLKHSEFKQALAAGEFVFLFDGEQVKVEQDINSLVTYDATKNQLFSKNRVIRVLDTVNNDLLKQFSSSYVGKIDNNTEGQSLLISAVDEYMLTLEKANMIKNYTAGEDFEIIKGEGDSVWANIGVQPVDSMEKFYFTVKVA
jgi:hypothetical protein